MAGQLMVNFGDQDTDDSKAAIGQVSLRPIAVVMLFAFALILVPAPALADCFDDAAAYHQVNPWIMRAIAMQESRFNPATVTVNKNMSTDTGLTGMNSVHLPELSQYGISKNDLLDPCKSIYVGAWHLRKMINRYGNTWRAVGSYHSKTQQHRDYYSSRIKAIIDHWVSSGIMPPYPTSEPSQTP